MFTHVEAARVGATGSTWERFHVKVKNADDSWLVRSICVLLRLGWHAWHLTSLMPQSVRVTFTVT